MKRLILLGGLMTSIAFASDAVKIFTLDKSVITENSSSILSHARFVSSYNECIGEVNKPLLTLNSSGKHKKIQSPLTKLRKSLNWQRPRLNKVESITKKILLWDESEADKILQIPESDIKLIGSFSDSLRDTEHYSLETYFATIVWGDAAPPVNYTMNSKCYSIGLAKVGQGSTHINGDSSLQDKAILNLGLPVGLVVNRVLATERFVRKDYLKFSSKRLSLITGIEERCLSAKSTLHEPYKNHFSPEYISQAQTLCDAVSSNEVQAIKVISKEFYDLTLAILLESGETKVSKKSRYSTLFKDHQSSLKDRMKTTREIQVIAINYEKELRREYAAAYLVDKSSDLTAKLSVTLDEVFRARGKGQHLDYFPYYKLIEWRNNKKARSDALTLSQPDTNLQKSYAVRVANCILKDKADYMSLDWYHENRLRLFTEKFAEIKNVRDKLVYETPTKKRENELLKKIGHSKANALKFLTYAQETGKERHQELLLNLLACNGE